VLACYHEELGWPHDLGYTVDEPFGIGGGDGWDYSRKGGWLMMAAGNGVQITESRFGGLHPTPSRTWRVSSRPLALDEWARSPR
jgi:hypothetical protein